MPWGIYYTNFVTISITFGTLIANISFIHFIMECSSHYYFPGRKGVVKAGHSWGIYLDLTFQLAL